MAVPGAHTGDRLRRRYSFGDFTLDLNEGFLRRRGDIVALRPKPFEVLVYLVEHHGRLVTKTELTDAVWPETAVVEKSLAQCVVEVRRALDDDTQQVIQTVARRGYVFAAPVTTPVAEFPRSTTAAIGASPVTPDGQGSTRVSTRSIAIGALAVLALAGVVLLLARSTRAKKPERAYTQITNFTDSAVSPALSPDGRMLAFIRSENWWLTTDQIYVKLLPDGDPIQITHDPRPKYAPAFSPDGSRIIYNVSSWSTYTVSPLGGEPSLFLSNSSGVTWLDRRRILFSEVNPPRSVHMGVVTALEDRSDKRTVYFPQDERGMVHLSYPSPDRQWAVVLEMNPVWQPCRVVPLDAHAKPRPVGPSGVCTSTGWSPDGRWMYFGVEINGSHHLWRQRFPDGQPEQITFGPTEEDGVAVAPDGRSLITSIGMYQSALWIHDSGGDRALSFRGNAASPVNTNGIAGTLPRFSHDGQSLFYLNSETAGARSELWKVDVASGTSEKALPGISMLEFDVSDDARRVVYATQSTRNAVEIRVAPLDRSSAPVLLSGADGDSPRFGSDGRILFRTSAGAVHYLEQIDQDGSRRSRVVPYPIDSLFYTSPDRRWVSAIATTADGVGGTYAVPLDGSAPRRVCSGCPVVWGPDGRFLYLAVNIPSRTGTGQTRAVPIPPGDMLPPLPPSGMRGLDDPNAFPGSHLIGVNAISPSPDPSVYAYVRITMHRNLFRIPLQ